MKKVDREGKGRRGKRKPPPKKLKSTLRDEMGLEGLGIEHRERRPRLNVGGVML